MRGKIIVIEGTDCSGKETQSILLEKRLKEKGKKCVRFGFPMYDTPTGKIVGGPYLGNPEISAGFFPEGADQVDPHIASLYYAADRKYNMSKIEFLFALKIADIKGQNPKYINRINQLLKIKAKYIEIRNFYNEISYNGNDLIKLGFKDKEIGIILDDIKRKIINNQLENKKEMISNYVIKNYKE